jgi:hypothetical protein
VSRLDFAERQLSESCIVELIGKADGHTKLPGSLDAFQSEFSSMKGNAMPCLQAHSSYIFPHLQILVCLSQMTLTSKKRSMPDTLQTTLTRHFACIRQLFPEIVCHMLDLGRAAGMCVLHDITLIVLGGNFKVHHSQVSLVRISCSGSHLLQNNKRLRFTYMNLESSDFQPASSYKSVL